MLGLIKDLVPLNVAGQGCGVDDIFTTPTPLRGENINSNSNSDSTLIPAVRSVLSCKIALWGFGKSEEFCLEEFLFLKIPCLNLDKRTRFVLPHLPMGVQPLLVAEATFNNQCHEWTHEANWMRQLRPPPSEHALSCAVLRSVMMRHCNSGNMTYIDIFCVPQSLYNGIYQAIIKAVSQSTNNIENYRGPNRAVSRGNCS